MDYSLVIIGAGVVGLACAERFSRDFDSILLIEKNSRFGEETSSRNSEVIHAGIYYPYGSLKSQLCINGRNMLYEFCSNNDITFSKTGKYIVAVNKDDSENLSNIYQNALNNGVNDIRYVKLQELNKAEPNIRACEAIFSPSTGIIDSHRLMYVLEAKSSANHCDFAYNHELISIEKITGGYNLTIKSDDEIFQISTELIINSAGLESDNIAKSAGIDIQKENLMISWCKGNYFKIGHKSKFGINHLIYPVPQKNYSGLGIHVTLDLSGNLRLGPNAEYMTSKVKNYSVDEDLKSSFFESASTYIKNIKLEDLSPDYSGIRPKLQKSGEPHRDWYINEESDKNLPGLINLIGIESPGLTSCLAIAEYCRKLI